MVGEIGGIFLNILITGGCGFIGSHLVRQSLLRPDINKVINYDALTYSGNRKNLEDIEDNHKYKFIHCSINDKEVLLDTLVKEDISIILHLAAESHVDRSIDSVEPFIKTNIDGTRNILECIKKLKSLDNNIKLIHVSTDEVYGSLKPNDPPFVEDTPLNPRNPYAATKASSDLLVGAFVNTYDISAIITRCSNNYGPNQFPEKLIPLMTLNALEGKKLPIYGDGKQIRDWIHVRDHVNGILMAMDGLINGKIKNGEIINFGADNERTNIDIVNIIIQHTGASEDQIIYVEDRLGHDRRYAMKFEKAARELGWSPAINWKEGLKETIDWYINNKEWVESIKSGEYLKWIEKKYEND